LAGWGGELGVFRDLPAHGPNADHRPELAARAEHYAAAAALDRIHGAPGRVWREPRIGDTAELRNICGRRGFRVCVALRDIGIWPRARIGRVF
jgi:hypothetical protein